MKSLSPILPQRGKYQGTRQILQYNAPLYAGALLACAGMACLALWLPLPTPMKALLAAGIGIGLFWSVGSVLVSYYVYDRSELYRWQWIARLFPEAPRRWANLHAGLDETTPALSALFPDSDFRALDFYDPQCMTEPSIRRARRLTPAAFPALPADPNALPLETGTLEAAFVIFAAHEIRDAEARLRFFRELHRVLAPGGRLLLVEHLRDAANFLAFGPGFLHFLPRGEWLRLAHASGFAIVREFGITPFVRVFLLERSV